MTIFLILSIAACKHDPVIPTETTLMITRPQAILIENETLQFMLLENNEPVTQPVLWSSSHGKITQASGILSTGDIGTDTQQVIITAMYNNRKTSITLPITKTAFYFSKVSFSQTVLPIFESNCNYNGCHGNGSRAAQVELSCYDSIMRSVIPYNSVGSLVYFSMVQTDPLQAMPPAGKLHQDKIEGVKYWIDQGAKEN